MKKQKATLRRPVPSFPCKKFVLFGGAAEGSSSYKKKSETNSSAPIRR